MKRWTRNWTGPVKALVAGLGLAALAFGVYAVMPAAGTNIGNVANATYTDSTGKVINQPSNLVNTTVAQIGAMSLGSNNTKSATAGATLYAPHTLSNNGNGSDTFKITVADNASPSSFSNIQVFADDGTGKPTGAALCAGIACSTTGFSQTVASGGTFNFIVAYAVPGSASVVGLFDTATVTATAVNAATIPYASPTATNTDTVSLTQGAVFAATKAIAAPAVAAPSGAWPIAKVTGAASAASCATDPTATTWASNLLSSHASCSYTVYTISYTNNGGATGEFTMQDPLPSGLTYVKGSAVWSGAPGIALTENGTPNSNTNVVSLLSGNTLSVSVKNVAQNVSGSISFVAMVNPGAAVGATSTSNTAKFYSTSCDPTTAGNTPTNPCDGQTSPSTTGPQQSAGPTVFTVAQTYSLIAGKDANATTPDTSTPPPKTGEDITVVPTAAPGDAVNFPVVIQNKGNGTDTFNLTVPATGATVNGVPVDNFPAGTTFGFVGPNGTPLLDTNGDGIPDTGPVAPGATVNVTLVAHLPLGATSATPVDVLITATSVGSGTSTPVFDSVWAELSTIATPLAKVDLTNTAGGNTVIDGTVTPATSVACTTGSNCDLGKGPSANPTDTQPAVPGTGTAIFPIFVKNNDGASTTYDLTSTLPSGWTVKYVNGTDCTAAAMTSLTVGAGLQTQVNACVTPSANAPLNLTSNVTFTATSTTNPAYSDSILDAVKTVPPVIKQMALSPNTTGSVSPGGSSTQPVTLSNTGNQTCGTGSNGFNVTATLDSASAAAGWTVGIFIQGNATPLAAASTPIGNLTSTIAPSYVPLVAASNLPLVLKFFAPSNAAIPSTATATLTVTDLSPAACPSSSNNYSMTATNGQLSVSKTEAYDKACTGTALATAFVTGIPTPLSVAPGECIVYKVVATNTGNGVVNAVSISDVSPPNTAYLATPASASFCAVTGGTPTTPTFTQAAGAVGCADATTGVMLNPGGTLTLQFPVKVNQ